MTENDAASPTASAVVWTRRSLRDLESIGAYIARDNPVAAANWLERLFERAVAAAVTPTAGRIVPEFAREEIREVFLRTYRIVYRVRPDGIVVLTVFEGHRRLGALPDDD